MTVNDKNDITFLNQPKYTPNGEIPDVVFLGVSANTSYYDVPGVENGTNGIREVSQRYSNADGSSYPSLIYNPERGYILRGIKIQDAGDIGGEIGEFESQVTAKVKEILSNGAFPIVLGGDHYITESVLEAYETPLTVIQIDAHSDYLPFEAECPHGSVMRASYNLDNVTKIIHAGLRGNLNCGESIKQSIADGNHVVTDSELKQGRLEAILSLIDQDELVYITFDADALDPSIAPAVGVPEPNGIDYQLAHEIITGLSKHRKVVGFEFVEYNPKLEQNPITGIHIVNLIIDFMSSQFQKKLW